jgi:hypothetical protein
LFWEAIRDFCHELKLDGKPQLDQTGVQA